MSFAVGLLCSCLSSGRRNRPSPPDTFLWLQTLRLVHAATQFTEGDSSAAEETRTKSVSRSTRAGRRKANTESTDRSVETKVAHGVCFNRGSPPTGQKHTEVADSAGLMVQGFRLSHKPQKIIPTHSSCLCFTEDECSKSEVDSESWKQTQRLTRC